MFKIPNFILKLFLRGDIKTETQQNGKQQAKSNVQQIFIHLLTMNVTMTRPNTVLNTTAITELMMMISGLSALYCTANKTQSNYTSSY